MMDRTFSAELNAIIVEKAIRWAPRGIVGIDIAGPRPGGERYDHTQVAPMVETAREVGLAFTIATDGPEMMRTHLRDEFELLLRIGALNEHAAREANARGQESAFTWVATASRPEASPAAQESTTRQHEQIVQLKRPQVRITRDEHMCLCS